MMPSKRRPTSKVQAKETPPSGGCSIRTRLTREQLEQLLSRARQEGRAEAARRPLQGSIKLRRNLEAGSAEAGRMLLDSAARTAEELTRG